MNTKENSIDIYTYPENATPIQLAEYQLEVMRAAERGEPVEVWTGHVWSKNIAPAWAWSATKYRIARPKIAEGHNPDKLTVDQVQVQDGWRLLSVEECKECERLFRQGEWLDGWFYNRHEKRWKVGGCRDDGYTYRTKNPPGHYLPKPEPVKKLVPWTFETAPKGCVLVRRMSGHAQLVLGWGGGTVALHTASSGIREMDYEDLMSDYEHSTDSGKTWLPCGTDA